MASSIFLNDLEFFGTHGAYPSEYKQKQKFLISVEISGDFLQAAQTDRLIDTVDYSAIYEIVRTIVETKHFNLIEALAHKIAHEILGKFERIQSITIVVKKFPATWTGRNYGNIGFKTTITR